jgi:uncharacterized membrane protein
MIHGSQDIPSSSGQAALVCVLVSPIPVLMVLTIIVLRSGYSVPVGGLLRITGIALLMINVLAFGDQARWFLRGPALALLTLFGVILAGMSFAGTPRLGAVLALAGALACLRNVLLAVRTVRLAGLLALVLLGLAVGLYVEAFYWQYDTHHDILYPESMVAGRSYSDVMFYSAVVNMISTYKVAFTGVDGIVPLHYHSGSLWIAEAFRRLCGLRTLEFIAFGFAVLLLPLYVAAFFDCALRLRRAVLEQQSKPPILFWAACATALVGVFPLVGDPLQLNFNATILNSDNFALSLAMVLLFIAVVAGFYETRMNDLDRSLSRVEQGLVAFAFPAIVWLIGFVKISLIAILTCLALYLCWRVRSLRKWYFMTCAALSVSALIALAATETGATTAHFAPFMFDRIAPEWVPYFFVIYFAWPWLFLLLWARREGVSTLGDVVNSARTGRTLPVEIVFVSAIVGVLPYLLLEFQSHAPNWRFFTVFQAVLAGVFVVAYLADSLPASRFGKLRLEEVRLQSVLVAGLAIAILGHLGMTTVGVTYRLLKRNALNRLVRAGGDAGEWRRNLRLIRGPQPPLAEAFQARAQLVRCLETIGKEPVEQRAVTALYVPKTNRVYWDMRQLDFGVTPFIAPAVAGVTMVRGLPEYEDIGGAGLGFGYPQFKLPSGPAVPVENDEDAMSRAKQFGLRRLLILRSVARQGCELEERRVD